MIRARERVAGLAIRRPSGQPGKTLTPAMKPFTSKGGRPPFDTRETIQTGRAKPRAGQTRAPYPAIPTRRRGPKRQASPRITPDTVAIMPAALTASAPPSHKGP